MQRIAILALAFFAAPAFAASTPSAADIQAALAAAAPAKLAVAETHARTGHWVGSNDEAGYTSPVGRATVSIGTDGVISIVFDGPVITLTPTADHDVVRWSCTTTGLAAAAIPAGCR